jgi:hypothetical protein
MRSASLTNEHAARHLPHSANCLRGCRELDIAALLQRHGCTDLPTFVRYGLCCHGRFWICVRRAASPAKTVSSAAAFPTASPPAAFRNRIDDRLEMGVPRRSLRRQHLGHIAKRTRSVRPYRVVGSIKRLLGAADHQADAGRTGAVQWQLARRVRFHGIGCGGALCRLLFSTTLLKVFRNTRFRSTENESVQQLYE